MKVITALKANQVDAIKARREALAHGIRHFNYLAAQASGKSTGSRIMLMDDVNEGRAVIIITPTEVVSENFGPLTYDGRSITPQTLLSAKVKNCYRDAYTMLKEYQAMGRTPCVMVITKQTLLKIYTNARHLLRNCTIVNDEAHMTCVGLDDTPEKGFSQAFYDLATDPTIRTIRMTATDFRANPEERTMPSWYEAQSATYRYTMAQMFHENTHVKGVRVVVRNYLDIDAELEQQFADHQHHKMLYIYPPVQSGARLDDEPTDTLDRLLRMMQRVLQSSAPVRQGGYYYLTKPDGSVHVHANLINDQHRSHIYYNLRHWTPDTVASPDLFEVHSVSSLETMTTGADWPVCEVVSMLGPRRSAPQVAQIMGRPIREMPNKLDTPRVEVFVPLPLEYPGEAKSAQMQKINTFLNDVLMLNSVGFHRLDYPEMPRKEPIERAPRGPSTPLPPITPLEILFEHDPHFMDIVERKVRQEVITLQEADVPKEDGIIAIANTISTFIQTERPLIDVEIVEQAAMDFVTKMVRRGEAALRDMRLTINDIPDWDLIEHSISVINADRMQIASLVFGAERMWAYEQSVRDAMAVPKWSLDEHRVAMAKDGITTQERYMTWYKQQGGKAESNPHRAFGLSWKEFFAKSERWTLEEHREAMKRDGITTKEQYLVWYKQQDGKAHSAPTKAFNVSWPELFEKSVTSKWSLDEHRAAIKRDGITTSVEYMTWYKQQGGKAHSNPHRQFNMTWKEFFEVPEKSSLDEHRAAMKKDGITTQERYNQWYKQQGGKAVSAPHKTFNMSWSEFLRQ